MKLQKISTILRETTVPKITGHLIKFNDDNEFVGKCALGVLACESGNPDYALDYKHRGGTLLFGILNQYKIPKYLRYNLPTINITHTMGDIIIDINYDNTQSLTKQIVMLNDEVGLSFKEIADFLEETFDL